MDIADLAGKTIKQVIQGDSLTVTDDSFWELMIEFTDGTTLKILPWMYCADNCIIDVELEEG